jgi:YD repeat-containing protein
MNALGGAPAALARAAAMAGIARARAIPPMSFGAGGCNSLAGSCVINPSGPTVFMQIAPPAGDSFYIVPALSYLLTNPITSAECGVRWSHTFKRQVQVGVSNTAGVVTGEGQSYNYFFPRLAVYGSPTSNALNSLKAGAGNSSFTETQPDGTLYQYAAGTTSAPASLLYIQNPAGVRWTMTYDGSGRVSAVTDPIERLTTLAYDATSGKLSSIQDPFGRRTTVTVNSSGDLVQVLSPELCVTSFVYDSSHNLIARVNPLGDRLTFSYPSGGVAVQTPLGAITTLIVSHPPGGPHPPPGPSGATGVGTSPLGQMTTLSFSASGALTGAIDPLGNTTTYNWDSSDHLLSIGDGLGNVTSFSYVANLTNKVSYLSSVTQPLGGIFTYNYNNSAQVTSVVDQLGNTTSLVWNSAGYRIAAIDPSGNRTSYAYTSLGRLASVQNPAGQIVTLVYNTLGQQIALVNPLGNRLSYTYNANGIVQSVQNPLG